MSDKDITTYLAENPRKIGALFTLVLLLTQAGNSAAMWGTDVFGP